MLPVTITNVSGIGLLESARTTYFIIKGAALINVVANIKENYFPIKWNSDVSKMITITVEALVRSDDWVAKRDNALSSVFGIEGNFLIRIGDGDRHVINFRHLCQVEVFLQQITHQVLDFR